MKTFLKIDNYGCSDFMNEPCYAEKFVKKHRVPTRLQKIRLALIGVAFSGFIF